MKQSKTPILDVAKVLLVILCCYRLVEGTYLAEGHDQVVALLKGCFCLLFLIYITIDGRRV